MRIEPQRLRNSIHRVLDRSIERQDCRTRFIFSDETASFSVSSSCACEEDSPFARLEVARRCGGHWVRFLPGALIPPDALCCLSRTRRRPEFWFPLVGEQITLPSRARNRSGHEGTRRTRLCCLGISVQTIDSAGTPRRVIYVLSKEAPFPLSCCVQLRKPNCDARIETASSCRRPNDYAVRRLSPFFRYSFPTNPAQMNHP